MASPELRERGAWPIFEQVEPYSQACPDCSAKVGEHCIHADADVPKTMVHIRRCFTPRSDGSIRAHYMGSAALTKP